MNLLSSVDMTRMNTSNNILTAKGLEILRLQMAADTAPKPQESGDFFDNAVIGEYPKWISSHKGHSLKYPGKTVSRFWGILAVREL